MPELAKAYVQIIPSAEGIQGEITTALGGEAEAAGKSSGEKYTSGFASVAKTGLAAIGALAGAAAAAGGAIVKGASDVAAYGDNIDKMSQKLGLSTEAYQKWDYVLGQSGADINSMQVGLKTLTNKLDDAKNGSESAQQMFAALGLSLEDLSSMSREDVFENVIFGFQGMADSTERAALANDLFGKSGQELTPLFNESAASTRELMQAAEDLGFVMSEEAVTASADFQDALDTLQRTFGGLKNGLMAEFLPGITEVMSGLTAIFSGDSGGLEAISSGVESVVNTISGAMPRVMEVGGSIIVSLASAISSNLPSLLSAAADAILMIAQGLIENLPEIIKAGLEVIISLANGIAESLPELIPTIVDVVLQIVDTLTDPGTLGSLIDASIAIIIALANGLIAALPQLIAKAPEIIANLVTAIIENVPKLLAAAVEIIVTLATGIGENLSKIFEAAGEIITTVVNAIGSLISDLWAAGKSIIDGIWQGISNTANWLWEQVKGFFGGLLSKIKDFLGIASPSKVFAEMGKNMGLGLALGIEAETGTVEKAVGDMADAAVSAWNDGNLSTNIAVRGAYNLNGGGQLGGSFAQSDTADIVSTVLAVGNMIVAAINEAGFNIELDGETLSRQLRPYSQAETKRVGMTMVT